MKNNLLSTGLVSCCFLFLAGTSCTKLSKEQVQQAIKEDPSLLADAIKKNPEAFKETLRVVQDSMREAHAREQAEQAQKEQEARFADPLKPNLTAAQVYKGSEQAKILIVEYTDFQCPYCSRGSTNLNEVLKKYEGKVRMTVKHLPLPFHNQAMPAAKYFEAIRMQNPQTALAFHDVVFAKQSELGAGGEAWLDAEAKKLGVNMTNLKADLKQESIAAKISEDMKEAGSFGFKGTPAFIVGGVPVRGAVPVDEFARIIDRLLAKS